MAVEIIKAFCWTLFHSLWQGAIIALIAAVFVSVFFRAKPVVRYAVFLSLLSLFVLCFLVTLSYELSTVVSGSSTEGSLADSKYFIAFTDKVHFTSWQGEIAESFNRFIPFLFAVWLIFFFIKISSFLRQLAFLKQIRSNAQPFPGGLFKSKLESLIAAINLSKKVSLLQSAGISVPILIGYVKPVILFPIGFVNNLTTAQVEAILLHELIHIKRNDYFINVIQTLLETILFFNPAFLWISRKVREERENCCDDAVIEKTGDKKTYVTTLINSYEFSLNAPGLGVYFANRQSVVPRVKRIIEGRNSSLGISNWFILVLGIVFCLVLFTGFSKKRGEAPVNKTEVLHYHDGKICYERNCKKLVPQSFKDSVQRLDAIKNLDGLKAGKMIKNVIEKMLQEKVIFTTGNLSFRLDKQKLVVNGEEQASCITQMLQDDFLKKTSLDYIEYKPAY